MNLEVLMIKTIYYMLKLNQRIARYSLIKI